MVSTLTRSSLREIRQSLGRYLAILAIIALGVGFFAGIRMAQPDMLATGIRYLDAQHFYDLRLLSSLGFTEEDVAYFNGLDEVHAARGAVYTEFLSENEQGEEIVLMAHSLTDGINEPSLTAGRMPHQPNECVGDSNRFTEQDLGKTIRVSAGNRVQTQELLAYEEYTLVGIGRSPCYLNLDRGTASIGSGSISAFVLIPEDGFDFEAYYEIYLTLNHLPETYSQAYKDRLDVLQSDFEGLAQERADLRYNTLYEDALAEIRDAEQELTDGEQEIADAYVQLDDLEQPDVYLLTRNENTGYVSFDNDTSIVKAISLVFPVFFFLVAALVCMTTMTRMVDEQRTQTGVLKALGYRNGQIMGKYLFYSGSAALIGSILGYTVGSLCLPWIIWQIYGILYAFADLTFLFDPALAALSLTAALLCSMGATWLACRVELAQPAAELIRPKTPKAGKRVFLEYLTPLWKQLSFLQKVSVRNVLRYRSRLIMMILGIGGCTALLVTGFGLRDSITTILDSQYDEITLYDHSVTFRTEPTQEDLAQYLSARGWTADNALLVHAGSTDLSFHGASKSVYLIVPSSGSADRFLDLHNDAGSIPFPGLGEVVLNTGLAEHLGISAGDTVSLRIPDLGSITATVSAVCENYIFNYVYLAPETFIQQLGQPPEYQTLYLLSHPDSDPYAEGATLSDSDAVSSVTVNAALREQFSSTLSRMDLIVVIVVVCAAALVFIVLYNLTNINITERIREIATIRVLGFYERETSSYVFREIHILSVVGSLFGLLLGKALHAFVMAQVQVDGFFFPTQIAPFSYFISVLLTLLFTVLITNLMRPKLRKVDMAESLKSIE